MVRGTFSPARAWRPAVVDRLARTLGRLGDTMLSSRGRACHQAREVSCLVRAPACRVPGGDGRLQVFAVLSRAGRER